jgi:hypothetical protein
VIGYSELTLCVLKMAVNLVTIGYLISLNSWKTFATIQAVVSLFLWLGRERIGRTCICWPKGLGSSINPSVCFLIDRSKSEKRYRVQMDWAQGKLTNEHSPLACHWCWPIWLAGLQICSRILSCRQYKAGKQ